MMNMILSTGSAAQVAFHVTNLIETIVAIGGVCVALPIVIVWMVVRARTHRMDKKMEILMKAVDNGQQVDPALLVTAETGGKKNSIKNNILNRLLVGACLTITGVSAIVLFCIFGDVKIQPYLIALICLSVGIGFLISYFVGRNFLAKEIAIEEKQLLETEAKQLVEEQQKQ